MSDSPLLASIELGGTKAIVGIARDPLVPLARGRIATEAPAATLSAITTFLLDAAQGEPISAIGIASFGPLDLAHGRIGATPKPGWSHTDLCGYFAEAFNCPVALDTDVNGAALAEARLGAGQGRGSLAYITVGTGIGGGLVINDRPVHGLLHPEMGHLRAHPVAGDAYPGCCPYHGGCIEGLASGPAIVARFGRTLGELAADHPFRQVLAEYLGQLAAAIVLISSPERIVIGGGVMADSALHGAVAEAMRRELAGYLPAAVIGAPDFIVPPALGEDSGLIGGFLLAQEMRR